MMTSSAAEPLPLKHGYTTGDLDMLIRTVMWWTHSKFLPFDERRDAARFAIVEHILATTERPGFWSLVIVGQQAIRRHIVAEEHWCGYYLSGSRAGRPITRHFRYWHGSTRLRGSSPQDRVVDHLALQQIWPKLTKGQQATLLAIAKHNNFDKAAAELGTTHHALTRQLYAARRQFLRWWHQHEQPSHIWAQNSPRDPSKDSQYPGIARTLQAHKRRAAKANGRDARGRQNVKSGGPKKAGEASCR